MIDQIAQPDHLYRTFVQIQLRYWDGHPARSRFPPGADGETLPAFARNLHDNLVAIAGQLREGVYRFSPFVERIVIAPGGREKRLSRATLRDTLAQKSVAAIVEPALDAQLPASLHAFRRRRPDGPGLHQALTRAAQASRSECFWVVQEDVRAYFEHIRHDLLLETLAGLLPEHPRVLDIYAAYLAAPRQTGEGVLPREVGLPIGSILSNFLANVYLLPLDRAAAQAGLDYARYCDDILVFAPGEVEARQARELIVQALSERGLEINPEKSRLLPPRAPFVYLGYEFEGASVRIGARALQKFRRKVQRVTARGRWPRLKPSELDTPPGRAALSRLIRQVNRLVGGNAFGAWPRYFARAGFDDQFRELDQWIRRRIRAALLHRWRESDARYLPDRRLQALGLRTLVGEYWRWRQMWRQRRRSLLSRAARLEQLREALDRVKARAWNPYRRCYCFHPGLDGLTLADIAADERAFLLELQARLLSGAYRFGAFVEYARPRQERDEPRWIARPGLADAIVSRALASVLAARLDRCLPEQVHSYRRGKGNWTASGQLQRWLLAGSAWIVRADVAGFLDQINLARLEELLDRLLPGSGEMDAALRNVLRSYVWSGRWRAGEGLLPREQGLPRGGSLTPLLGNLYLLGLDTALLEARVRFVRYADDIVVVASTAAEAQAAWAIIQEQAAALNLPLHPAKSGVFAPNVPFEFLGYRIQGRRFDVRPYAINRLKRRVRRVTRRHRWADKLQDVQSPQGRQELARLVRQVNRLLVYASGRNWVSSFARCTDDATFRELDCWIADRIRACITGRWSPRNRRLAPDALLREMGLVRLATMYYHARRRIAGQAAQAALARQISASPDAGG